jgi:S1-C subfamily serine protease
MPLTPREIAARVSGAVVTLRGKKKLGTGFIVRSDGWIATNAHVIEGEESVEVAFADGRTLSSSDLVGVDTKHDLAIVRVDAKNLEAVTFATERAVEAGDAVVAIGNPLGLERTVTNGLVSSVRTMDDGTTVLQISVPISHGSSGGPVLDQYGRVIGISTATVETGQNLNFAVPVAYLAELIKHPVATAMRDVRPPT